jgi:putative transposase
MLSLGAAEGLNRVVHLDETGFGLSLPPAYSWTARGKKQCPVCAQGLGKAGTGKPDINPKGIYVWFGHLEWEPGGNHRVRFCVLEGACRTGQGRLVGRAECSDKPVVRPFHRSRQLLCRAVEREQAGLPWYSPQLNPMENVWRRIKGFLLPRRFYPTVAELRAAVIAAFKVLNGLELKIQCAGT